MEEIRLEIRPVTPEDAERIAEIEKLCFPEGEAASLENFRKRIDTFGDSFFVGEADGSIIAFVNGAVTDSQKIYDEMYHDMNEHKPEGDYQVIFGLCTHPAYQKRGLAEVMLSHMIYVTRQRGKKGLILTSKEHLIHYYEKFGFVNHGISQSSHGGAVWHDMMLEF